MAANTFFATKTILASLLAIGIAGGVQAQAPSTLDAAGYMLGGQVAGNIVGGGTGAEILGGGNDTVITYNQPGAGGGGAGWGQAGRFARFGSTHGDGPQVEYLTLTPTGAGREARLTGGGDNAEVTYTSPYQRR